MKIIYKNSGFALKTENTNRDFLIQVQIDSLLDYKLLFDILLNNHVGIFDYEITIMKENNKKIINIRTSYNVYLNIKDFIK